MSRPLVRWTLVVVWMALTVPLACRTQKPDPEETLRVFLQDLRAGRTDAAWAVLSAASQRSLEQQQEARARALGQAEAEVSAASLLFETLGVVSISIPESIAVASPQGQEVRLRVAVKDGRSADVHMLLEGDRWRVDLLRTLKPSPALANDLGQVEPTESATVAP